MRRQIIAQRARDQRVERHETRLAIAAHAHARVPPRQSDILHAQRGST